MTIFLFLVRLNLSRKDQLRILRIWFQQEWILIQFYYGVFKVIRRSSLLCFLFFRLLEGRYDGYDFYQSFCLIELFVWVEESRQLLWSKRVRSDWGCFEMWGLDEWQCWLIFFFLFRDYVYLLMVLVLELRVKFRFLGGLIGI